MTAAALVASELSVHHGACRLAGPLSLEVHGAAAIGLCGPSGSGKSTLLRALVGLLPEGLQASGEIRLLGVDVCDPASDALAERDAVVRAFAGLSDPDREALRLVAWDDLPLATAARAAGRTRVAFAMRVSRARRRLAAALEEPDTALTLTTSTSTPLRRTP